MKTVHPLDGTVHEPEAPLASRTFFWSNFPWHRFTMYECFVPSSKELREKVDDPVAFSAWRTLMQPPGDATEPTCQAPVY